MIQQGQVFALKRASREHGPLWAYRYRLGGRGTRRVQRGGFASEEDAVVALERELERVRRERRVSRSLTLTELVDVYLAQHDVQPVTIAKLRWLLDKALAVSGDRRIGELTSQEIAEWRMTVSPGYRFDATRAPAGSRQSGGMGDDRHQPGQGRSRQPDPAAQGAAPL